MNKSMLLPVPVLHATPCTKMQAVVGWSISGIMHHHADGEEMTLQLPSCDHGANL